jgi:hypothetical protein
MIPETKKTAAAEKIKRTGFTGYSFPPAAKIREMTDPKKIQDEIDRATLTTNRIRADLEFPVKVTENGNPDPEWDRKARTALSYGMSAISMLVRQLHIVTRDPKKAPSAVENRRQNLIAQYLKAESDRTKLVNRQMSERDDRNRETDFHAVFARLARQLLPPATYEYIHDAAEEKAAEAARASVPALSEIAVLPLLQPFEHFEGLADRTIETSPNGSVNGGRDVG